MSNENLKNLFNEIEKITVCGLSYSDKEQIDMDIDNAVEEGETYINYDFEIEKIRIEWDNDFNYSVENVSVYDKDKIVKAYVVSEATGKSAYKVLNERGGQFEGQKFIDRFYYYKEEEKEQVINEWLENAIEEDNTEEDIQELRESFENQFDEFIKVTGGYIEKGN